MSPQLEPWMLILGAPDVNPTICAWCKKPHQRQSAFCSKRCYSRFAKYRQKRGSVEPATLEELKK